MDQRNVMHIRGLLSSYGVELSREMDRLIRVHLSRINRSEFTETGGYEPLIRDLFLFQHKCFTGVVDKLLEILEEIEPKSGIG